MPYTGWHFDKLKKAYENGELTEEEIDYNVNIVLDLIEKNENAKKTRKIKRTKEERYAIARKAESEGIVLLKNEDGILPLKQGLTVAVSGDAGNDALCGAGSAPVTQEAPLKNLSDSLKDILGQDKVTFRSTTSYKANHLGFYQQVWDIGSTIEQASRADVAVVTVGTGSFVEYEGGDRESCKLPKIYEDHILAVAKQNPNTVVVVYAGSYIDMSNWIDKVKGVIFAGFGGMEMHQAVADILTGKINPSGKLSETFPYTQEDVPSVNIDHDATTIRYIEGLDVGYRYFKTEEVPVEFPFGHGLSYTDFEYSSLQVEKKGKYDYTVTLSVKNAGAFDGSEVVQLYVRDPIAKVYRPYFELKGFDKKFIKAGETATYTFNLDKRAFAYYSVSYDEWTVENGTFEIMIGASSEDIRLKAKIEIE
jgi:beta-glucosidase